MDPIYLDHNATTPVAPEVLEAMLPYFNGVYGNASSVHSLGREAKVALENARERIAELIGCSPAEFYFTSGGTESDNLAVTGAARQQRGRCDHLVIGSTEHHAILETAQRLTNWEGFRLDLLPVDAEGFAHPGELAPLLTEKTAIVSVMHANNETGAIQDIPKLAAVAHEAGILFHTDAVQTIGKIPVNCDRLGVDMLSLTAHKVYGPKGIGGLFIRQGVKITPLFFGGSHEKKRRPGTENVAGAVGLAKTLELAHRRMTEDHARLTELADFFISGVQSNIPDACQNGPRSNRVPQTVNLSFEGIEGESIVLSLDMEGICCSSGSACSSGATGPSHVLEAMHLPPLRAQGAVRFSMGHSTTREQMQYVLDKLGPFVLACATCRRYTYAAENRGERVTSHQRVLVAMSGGVDSSVAALLLKEQGYDVIGAHMKLWDYAEVGADIFKDGRCCSLDSVTDCRFVCDKIAAPFYVLNLSEEFRRDVIEDFVSEYKAGRTPNPCVRCNTNIKWSGFLTKARELGCDYIATGHYSFVEQQPKGYYCIRKGVDATRDQSYVLWGLGQDALSRTLMPLGGLLKSEVRQIARANGLRTADKAESREICFVADNDYRRFLAEYEANHGRRFEPGEIVHEDGRVLGTHTGTAFYTIGQRRGLGIGHPTPLYVQRIDVPSRRVIVGENDSLLRSFLRAARVNWMGPPPQQPCEVTVKIRYQHTPANATVTPDGRSAANVAFAGPQRAVTPGQSVVFYDGDILLGGGIIVA